MLLEILSARVEDDGISFDVKSLDIRHIRIGSAVLGLRAKLKAYIGRTRIPCQIDVGLGDSVFPEPEPFCTPSILDFEVAPVLAYTAYSSIAEKLEAIVVLGMANTRMKDYFDLAALSSIVDLDGGTLIKSVKTTFSRRSTPIPTEAPEGLTRKFGCGRTQTVQWRAFLRKSGLVGTPDDFGVVVDEVATFLLPVLEAAAGKADPPGLWRAGGPWEGRGGIQQL